MPRTVRNTLTKVFEMLQPLYLGTFYVPPKNVKLPPPEVANKDLHQDKLLEIRQHWIMKLMAYAAKDGVICIFNVSHTLSFKFFNIKIVATKKHLIGGLVCQRKNSTPHV